MCFFTQTPQKKDKQNNYQSCLLMFILRWVKGSLIFLQKYKLTICKLGDKTKAVPGACGGLGIGSLAPHTASCHMLTLSSQLSRQLTFN